MITRDDIAGIVENYDRSYATYNHTYVTISPETMQLIVENTIEYYRLVYDNTSVDEMRLKSTRPWVRDS